METNGANAWVSILGSGGAAAIGVFAVWFLLTKHLPRMQGDFKEMLLRQGQDAQIVVQAFLQSMRDETAAFRAQLTADRESFRLELKAERETHALSLARLATALDYQNRLLLLLVSKQGPLSPKELADIAGPSTAGKET